MEDAIVWLNRYVGVLAVLNTLVIALLGFFFNRSQERLKSHLNSKFHAHTVRFEKEFGVMGNLWIAVIDLRNAVMALNSPIKYVPLEVVEEDEVECKRRQLVTCNEAFDRFFKAIDYNRPFFDQELRRAIEDIRKDAGAEASFTQRTLADPESIEYEDREASDKRRKAIREQIDVIEEAIRSRIKQWDEPTDF
jgi:hypothetical protein